jgi:hypothetical protein
LNRLELTVAGFSTPVDQQLRQILEIVGSALKDVSAHAREEQHDKVQHEADIVAMDAEREQRRQLIIRGGWHDGRLDCVAGNGPISELGFGEEPTYESDMMQLPPPLLDDNAPIDGEAVPPTRASLGMTDGGPSGSEDKARMAAEELDAESEYIKSLPIVVLKNFAQKTAKGDLWTVMAEWGASLVENRVRLARQIGGGLTDIVGRACDCHL